MKKRRFIEVVVPIITSVFVLSLGMFATGCGGGGTSASSGAAVSGNVSKGPINNANVDIYSVATDGYSLGTKLLGGIATDSYGDWSARLPVGASGPFIVVASGGSYVDEYTGNKVNLTSSDQMQGVLDTAYAAAVNSVAITPISDSMLKMMVQNVKQMITDGYTVADGYGSNLAGVLPDVRNQFAKSYGVDVSSVKPVDISRSGKATAEQLKYTQALGGISKLMNDVYSKVGGGPVRPFDVVQAMMKDLADGSIDGYSSAGNITIGTSKQGLNTFWTGVKKGVPVDLYTASQDFLANSPLIKNNIAAKKALQGSGFKKPVPVDIAALTSTLRNTIKSGWKPKTTTTVAPTATPNITTTAKVAGGSLTTNGDVLIPTTFTPSSGRVFSHGGGINYEWTVVVNAATAESVIILVAGNFVAITHILGDNKTGVYVSTNWNQNPLNNVVVDSAAGSVTFTNAVIPGTSKFDYKVKNTSPTVTSVTSSVTLNGTLTLK
ncbi:MAG: hypothetical protein R8J85_08480 [Mariprofundales bacterium]